MILLILKQNIQIKVSLNLNIYCSHYNIRVNFGHLVNLIFHQIFWYRFQTLIHE